MCHDRGGYEIKLLYYGTEGHLSVPAESLSSLAVDRAGGGGCVELFIILVPHHQEPECCKISVSFQ